MGCLIEFLFELVFEVVFELILTVYIELMTLLVPDHQFSPKLRERVKKGVTAFAAILLLCAFIGLILFLQTPITVKTVGKYMMFIPLGIIGVQTVAGIIYRIVRAIKRRQ